MKDNRKEYPFLSEKKYRSRHSTLGLSSRAYNVLMYMNGGGLSLTDTDILKLLKGKERKDFFRVRGLGLKTFSEIQEWIKKRT